MITLQTPSFLLLDSETQTTKKIKQGIIKYQTPNKGKVNFWITLEDEYGNEVTNALHTETLQDDYMGKDILTIIQERVLSELKALNPSVNISIV